MSDDVEAELGRDVDLADRVLAAVARGADSGRERDDELGTQGDERRDGGRDVRDGVGGDGGLQRGDGLHGRVDGHERGGVDVHGRLDRRIELDDEGLSGQQSRRIERTHAASPRGDHVDRVERRSNVDLGAQVEQGGLGRAAGGRIAGIDCGLQLGDGLHGQRREDVGGAHPRHVDSRPEADLHGQAEAGLDARVRVGSRAAGPLVASEGRAENADARRW